MVQIQKRWCEPDRETNLRLRMFWLQLVRMTQLEKPSDVIRAPIQTYKVPTITEGFTSGRSSFLSSRSDTLLWYMNFIITYWFRSIVVTEFSLCSFNPQLSCYLCWSHCCPLEWTSHTLGPPLQTLSNFIVKLHSGFNSSPGEIFAAHK
jgi:hypothetical protein